MDQVLTSRRARVDLSRRFDWQFRYGSAEPFRGGWSLDQITAPRPPCPPESADLAAAFEKPTTFCRHP